MMQHEAAWLAGFLDGEGHLGIHSTGGRPYYSVTVFLRNTHFDSMVHVQSLYRSLGLEKPLGHETRERGKDSWYLYVCNMNDVLTLARAVSAYSVTKQEEWNLLIEYTTRRLELTGHKKPYSERDMEVIARMNELSKRWEEPK